MTNFKEEVVSLKRQTQLFDCPLVALNSNKNDREGHDNPGKVMII